MHVTAYAKDPLCKERAIAPIQAITQTWGRDLMYNLTFKERRIQLLNDKPKQCCS